MGSQDTLFPLPSTRKQSRNIYDVEERRRLLGDDFTERLEPETLSKAWSNWKIAVTALVLIGLLITSAVAGTVFTFSFSQPHLLFHGNALKSNGTHDFRRTVLMVSIDGLRADYLDRGLTPHLLDISKKGLRAKSIRPIFPTVTFPNHWALMTGLYAESHGIIANNFWDPISEKEFHYNQPGNVYLPQWWLGEPVEFYFLQDDSPVDLKQMWETAMKAGISTANLMWPGPLQTLTGASPTYMVPWRDHVSLDEKLDQLFEWIDLPLEERPQLLLAYEPSLDQVGHKYGPFSAQVNSTLRNIDTFARNLHSQLVARNLTDIVDIVFVSDHGMVDTTTFTNIYIDKILGEDGMQAIEHVDGGPAIGIRFRKCSNESLYLSRLYEATKQQQFDVFTHETMPRRWHFSNNARIAPIYIVPKADHVLTTVEEGNKTGNPGNHGFDNIETAMQAIFVAHGPFAAVVKTIYRSKQRRRSLAWANKGWHSTSNDTYVMNTFPNVEIYGLIMKLLDIENLSTRNNGTPGFWDIYF